MEGYTNKSYCSTGKVILDCHLRKSASDVLIEKGVLNKDHLLLILVKWICIIVY
jgi:hypothetical protein